MNCNKFIIILIAVCICISIGTISFAKVVTATGGSTSHLCSSSGGSWGQYTSSLHAYRCSVCNQIQKTESHVFSGNSCMVCGYAKASVSTSTPKVTPTPTPKVTGHLCSNYIGDWGQYSATLHAKRCTKCNQIQKTEAHSFSGNRCSVCGYTKASVSTSTPKVMPTSTPKVTGHLCSNYIGDWGQYTATLHAKRCTKCNQIQKTEAHSFRGNRCSVCGYTKASVSTSTPKVTGHLCSNYIGDWEQYSATLHAKRCTKCNQIQKTEAHSFSGNRCSVCGYTKTLEDTTTPIPKHVCFAKANDKWYSNGSQHWKKCTVCGKNIVDKGNHTPKYGPYVGWEADDKYHWQECSICGKTYNKTAHSKGKIDPSKCGPCGYVLSVATPTPHKCIAKSWSGKYAGWDADKNQHWEICSICGKKMNIHNHNVTNGKCTTCGYIIVSASHKCVAKNWSGKYKGWDADKNQHWEICATCGKKMNIHDHNFTDGKCGACGYTKTKEILTSILHTHVYDTPVALTREEKIKYNIPEDSYLYYWMYCSCKKAKRSTYAKVIKNYSDYKDGEGYVDEDIKALLKAKSEKSGIPYEYLLGTFLRENTKDGTMWFGETWVKSCVNKWNEGNHTDLNNFFAGYFGSDKKFTAIVNGEEIEITPEILAKNPELLFNINVALELAVAHLKSEITKIPASITDTEESLRVLTALYGGTTERKNWTAEENKIAKEWTEAYYQTAMIVGTLEKANISFTDPGVGAFYCYLNNKAIGGNYSRFKIAYINGSEVYIPNNEISYTQSDYEACKKIMEQYESLIK